MNKILTTDLDKSYDDITFVTMCFNIRNSKEGHVNLNKNGNDRHIKREYIDFYVKNLEKLCAKFKDVVIYCDKECADNLNAPNAKLVVMKLAELPLYQKLSELKNLFQNMGQTIHQRRNMMFHLKGSELVYQNRALYASIVLSKVHILTLASKNKDVRSKYLCWLDAGLLGHQARLFDEWDGKITKYPHNGKIKVICSRNNDIKSTIYDIRHTKLRDSVFCRRPLSFSYRTFMSLLGREICNVNQMSAAVLFIEKKLQGSLESLYNEYLKRIMNEKLICFEQGIFTLMIAEHPGLFEVVLANGSEFIQAFFNGECYSLDS